MPTASRSPSSGRGNAGGESPGDLFANIPVDMLDDFFAMSDEFEATAQFDTLAPAAAASAHQETGGQHPGSRSLP